MNWVAGLELAGGVMTGIVLAEWLNAHQRYKIPAYWVIIAVCVALAIWALLTGDLVTAAWCVAIITMFGFIIEARARRQS
ncbi:MAG TPA: hypothetical protein VEV45_20645 [Streptosporangiaceae bacterium]|nr:hypothetical protein [Streptosporangiaceae bacterium]